MEKKTKRKENDCHCIVRVRSDFEKPCFEFEMPSIEEAGGVIYRSFKYVEFEKEKPIGEVFKDLNKIAKEREKELTGRSSFSYFNAFNIFLIEARGIHFYDCENNKTIYTYKQLLKILHKKILKRIKEEKENDINKQ